MKGNVKKLAVFVVIATIATFITAAMALASGNHRKAIHGEYAATSVVSCNGYYDDGTFESSGTISELAIYTFNSDGTGRMQGKFVRIGFSPLSENTLDFSWNFKYWVGDDGTITVATVPGTAEWRVPGTDIVVLRDTGGTYSESGRFSVDHKIITLGTVEVQDQELTFQQPNGPVFHAKCGASRVLIRVGE